MWIIGFCYVHAFFHFVRFKTTNFNIITNLASRIDRTRVVPPTIQIHNQVTHFRRLRIVDLNLLISSNLAILQNYLRTFPIFNSKPEVTVVVHAKAEQIESKVTP